MRWLMARALARHAANVARANPWPTAGAVTTRKVGGYPSGNKTAAEMKPLPANITTRTKGATMPMFSDWPTMPSKAPRSDSKPLAASVRPDAHDAFTEAAIVRVQLAYALDTIIRLTKERDEALATIARMRTGRP